MLVYQQHTYLYLGASYNPPFFIIKSLLLLVSNNNPSASAVATDSAVGYVLPLVFLGSKMLQLSLLLYSVPVSLHAVVVLTGVYVTVVSAVAKVSAVAAAPTAVVVLCLTVGIPCCSSCILSRNQEKTIDAHLGKL